MNYSETDFSAGNLVRARSREWVVQPGSEPSILKLRPLGGSDEDIVTLIPGLELEPVTSATFSLPDPALAGSHDAAMLLRDALLLKMRNAAGPFRSFGNIAIEPRAYQLVPLLMALRQPIIRLLIADDVGIGKTIEAGLIVRELLDRGEIARAAFLCPPHLVEQWQSELKTRFNISALALTANNVARIERTLPAGVSLFEQYPFVVVSLDYIKTEKHREHFLNIAPECIVVDEAHTCTSAGGSGKQLRFELLQRLVDDKSLNRHLIMLTATPHSGKDAAFYNLLSLLDPDFMQLSTAAPESRTDLRNRLAACFVQRRRKDIEEWQDTSMFPRRMTTELSYQLTGPWGDFFNRVYDYCIDLANSIERADQKAGSMIWYATLALLRCVSSSPAAAAKALSTRLAGITPEEIAEEEDRLYDGDEEALSLNDLEPAAATEDVERLRELIDEAGRLSGVRGDPKLAILYHHLETLIKDGFRPVVFCRFIATARYVAEELQKLFGDRACVDAVTGEYTPEERKERVEKLGEEDNPILIATDCLSEGINLQHIFDAAVHYDLAWNPTRHEQREGRVDRFGQKAKEVRCTMLYGQDNPVDGFVLNVILKKAETIRRDLGVLVPMPQDQQRINQAMVKAALLKSRSSSQKQLTLDFGDAADLEPLQQQWEDAIQKTRANRTVFAQRRLRPEEVMPEWQKQLKALGDEKDVERFVTAACARLNSPLETAKGRNNVKKLVPQHLPPALRERLEIENISRPVLIDFNYPAAERAQFVHRSHPLVALLADTVLESALNGNAGLAARSAVTVTGEVDVVTTLFLLRLRHQLVFIKKTDSRTIMAEETVAIAARGRHNPQWVTEEDCHRLLGVKPSANLGRELVQKELQAALTLLTENRGRLEEVAARRAEMLLADHRRVREAADDRGSYRVKACLPVDVMGVYVLLPDEL